MIPILLMLAVNNSTIDSPYWARFSRHGMLSHITDTVEIGSATLQGKPFRYNLRFTHETIRSKIVKDVDSNACPQIYEVLKSMQKIRMPAPAPYGVPGVEQNIILDGAAYSLTVPSSDDDGLLTLRSNSGSTFANWIDGSMKELVPCWADKAK